MLLWLLELDDGLLRNMLLNENGEGLRFHQVGGDVDQDAVAKAICDSYVASLRKPGESELEYAKRVSSSLNTPSLPDSIQAARQ